MEEGEEIEAFPVRTLHDLAERMVDEWNVMRGAVIASLVSSVFLTFFIIRWLTRYLRFLTRWAYGDALLLVAAFPCILFVLFSSIQQYRFYTEWRKRFQRLRRLEDELMRKYR